MPYFAIAHQIAMLVAEQAERASQADMTRQDEKVLDDGQGGNYPSPPPQTRRSTSMLLQDSGPVSLGAGWRITMPPGYRQRNSDDSWSLWGSGWSLDAHISRASPTSHEKAAASRDPLDLEDPSLIYGEGWRGTCQAQLELNGRRVLHHLRARLVTENSTLSLVACCIGEGGNRRLEQLILAVSHRSLTSILGRLFRRDRLDT